MSDTEITKLIGRFEALINNLENLDVEKQKYGTIRYKPLFSTYNSCTEEYKNLFPDEYDKLNLEPLPLYDEKGAEQFIALRLSTLLHQSRDILAVLRSLIPTALTTLKLPEQITLYWLLRNVPIGFWLWLFGLLVGAVAFGLYAGQVPWIKPLLPGYSSMKDNLIEELKKKEQNLEKNKKEIQEFVDRVKTYEEKIRHLRNENLQLKIKQIFPYEDPYPIGINQVRIGDNIKQIHSFYKASQIHNYDIHSMMIAVDILDNPFQQVLYSRLNPDKDIIDLICFMANPEYTDIIVEHALKTFGEKSFKKDLKVTEIRDETSYLWENFNGYAIDLKIELDLLKLKLLSVNAKIVGMCIHTIEK